ncbi:MAG: response regulator [Phycisphaerae bacterium]|nr:response regulator [Phycisphaerae bacterium]
MTKTTYEFHDVPEEVVGKWQKTVDLMAEIFEVPASLIMRVQANQIEVLVSSHTQNNPYDIHEKADLNTGLYCEKVMATRSQLYVPNALDDPLWKDNPDVKLNMIMYMGVPLVWPDGEIFGTICVLDDKERDFSKPYRDLMWELKKIIEGDFQSIVRSIEMTQANRLLAEAKQAAEAANRAKNAYLANMSHDIRTPMNGIIGFSNILANEALTEKQKSHVNIIRDSAANLLNLINDILDCSKIEAGQLNIEIIDCPLDQILNAQESMVATLAKEKCVDFKIITGRDLPAYIHSDPYRLNQCLTNLLSNAVKFTDQGHIHLKVALNEDKGKHFIQFDVEDTGIGIPIDRQEAIFESFGQADGSITRKYGGTGLGLTITRQLAELLGGELSLTSEPGKGSVFSLAIPTGVDITDRPLLDRSTTAAGTEELQQMEAVLFSGTVLVAEDVEANQILMDLMLSRLGLDVVIAEDGIQAMQTALSQTFDLILMDMQMPHMDGYQATLSLRQRGDKTPIVALTANAMKGDDQKCLEAGCDDYLAKPIDRRALLQILSKYLQPSETAMNKTIASVLCV